MLPVIWREGDFIRLCFSFWPLSSHLLTGSGSEHLKLLEMVKSFNKKVWTKIEDLAFFGQDFLTSWTWLALANTCVLWRGQIWPFPIETASSGYSSVQSQEAERVAKGIAQDMSLNPKIFATRQKSRAWNFKKYLSCCKETFCVANEIEPVFRKQWSRRVAHIESTPHPCQAVGLYQKLGCHTTSWFLPHLTCDSVYVSY